MCDCDALKALVRKLDIRVMHPHMDGQHQMSVYRNASQLTVDEWALIADCRDGDDD